MTAYKDIDNINNFIAHCPEDWGIYIHLDKKSKIKKETIDRRAVIFQWRRIYWGSFEHLNTIWRLILEANKSKVYDYFHIVSGQDYFASSPYSFDHIIGNNNNNFIGVEYLPANGCYWGDGGFDIFRYKYLTSYGDFRKPFWNIINRKFRLFQRKFHLERNIPTYPLAKGFVWCSLHKDFINWAIQSPLSRDLLKRLKNSIVAEEVFFQTLIINSPYKHSIVNHSMHYHDWVYPWPKILTADDINVICLEQKYLFCRKIDSAKSIDFINEIDNKLFPGDKLM